MRQKEKVTVEKKKKAIQEYLSGSKGVTQISYELQITKQAFRSWLRKYEMQGFKGLEDKKKNTNYPEVLKITAVEDYKGGKGSQEQICTKYGISTITLLQKWIKKYNGQETFNSHNGGGNGIMTKVRKTTYEERIEIVAFCVANNDNYQLAADKFVVSYHQVYSWVKKYKAKGYEGLHDNRGKHKNAEELSDSEGYVAQLKLLEAENRRLRMENDFLKKLDEIERRR